MPLPKNGRLIAPTTRQRPGTGRLVLGAILLFFAACTKSPQSLLDLQGSNGDWSDYHRSRDATAERQTPEERTEFGRALQEMKSQAMSSGRVHARPAIDAAVRAQIAGLTVRDVLVLS